VQTDRTADNIKLRKNTRIHATQDVHFKTHKNADGLTSFTKSLAYSRHAGRTFYNYELPYQTKVNPILTTSPLHFTSIWCTRRISSYICYSNI